MVSQMVDWRVGSMFRAIVMGYKTFAVTVTRCIWSRRYFPSRKLGPLQVLVANTLYVCWRLVFLHAVKIYHPLNTYSYSPLPSPITF